jgi:hypothetical protein
MTIGIISWYNKLKAKRKSASDGFDGEIVPIGVNDG